MKLILTKQKPYQAGYYWMTEAGHDDEYYEDPRNFHMVEVCDFGEDDLWVCGIQYDTSGYLKNIHNKLWAGPMPLPEKKDGV